MRSTIVAVLSLFMATAVLAQWEPPDAPQHRPDDGRPPNVYFAHSYFKDDHTAGLDDRISVHVQNFGTLLKNANGNCQGIVLFLDGMSPRGYTHPVTISVGSDQQFSIPSTASFNLEVIPHVQFLAFLAIITLALAIFLYLCRTTSLVRSGTHPVPRQRPYSLSLFQMAFWFFLVIAAYVFVWLITDELDTITESILALIGIGAATALGATLIDQKKAPPAPDEPGGTSQGFLNDVLSDPTGISLHRFQMFVWTVVLGVIFIGSVYKNLAMPQFSATLLGLMGISSGTYLGFKVPEKTGSDTTPGATPDAPPEKPPGT